MNKLLRLGLAFVVVAGTLVGLTPGTVSAGSGASTVPIIMSPVTVGQTGTFSMRLQNDNVTNDGEPVDFGDLTNTVCNRGASQPGTNCNTGAIEGITYMPSCGDGRGPDATCALADPGVFQLATNATGTSGSCNGMSFDVQALGDEFGRYLFTPVGGGSVTLTGPDVDAANSECVISFGYTVLKTPTQDADPNIDGMQTIAVADHTQSVEGTQTNASGRGQSFSLTVNPATPFINTTASPGIALGGGTLTDAASLSGRQFPTDGSVTFRLYGPDDTGCDNAPIFTDANVLYAASPANGQTVTSAPFTPTLAGEYRWVATYNGDANNTTAVGVCGDPAETRVVTPANPTITTTASDDVNLGDGALVDTATVSGVVNAQAGATVTFDLYGPDDTTCASTPITSSTVPYPVTGGDITSTPFTPTVPGTYQWVASYSGDANNNPVSGLCGDTAEITEVAPATPIIVTEASDTVALGGELTDTATVTGRVNPQDSTIDFSLYGPNNDDCSGTPVFTSIGVAYGPTATSVTSEAFTPTLPGTYRWVATYNGDDNNAVAIGECGDPAETVRVFGGLSRIVTNASADTFVGDGRMLSDVATVLDRVDPDASGVVDFRLYGPNDATCSGTPIFESLGVAYPASGGAVTSESFLPTQAGVYRWVATYSGDENNSSATGTCGDPAETVTVSPTPDVDTELPATGPGGVAGIMALGTTTVLAGVMMLGLSNRRRRFGTI